MHDTIPHAVVISLFSFLPHLYVLNYHLFNSNSWQILVENIHKNSWQILVENFHKSEMFVIHIISGKDWKMINVSFTVLSTKYNDQLH